MPVQRRKFEIAIIVATCSMIFGVGLLVNGTTFEWKLLGALLLAIFAVAALVAHRLSPIGTQRLFAAGSTDGEDEDFK
jgi:uncharacterized membrane protein